MIIISCKTFNLLICEPFATRTQQFIGLLNSGKYNPSSVSYLNFELARSVRKQIPSDIDTKSHVFLYFFHTNLGEALNLIATSRGLDPLILSITSIVFLFFLIFQVLSWTGLPLRWEYPL